MSITEFIVFVALLAFQATTLVLIQAQLQRIQRTVNQLTMQNALQSHFRNPFSGFPGGN